MLPRFRRNRFSCSRTSRRRQGERPRLSAASTKPKQDFPDCAFCAPCRCDDECGCVEAGCWACGHRYDDVSGAVFVVSERLVSPKPTPRPRELIVRDLRGLLTPLTRPFDKIDEYTLNQLLSELESLPAAEDSHAGASRILHPPTQGFRGGVREKPTHPRARDWSIYAVAYTEIINQIDAQERAGAKTE